MFEITKDFHFSAGHHIDGLPPGHKCGKDHGHNYLVRLFLRSPDLNSVGFVVDFGELSRFGKWLDLRFDHRFLNEVLFHRNGESIPTTAEYLAFIFYHRAAEWFPQVYRVGVQETPKAWAFYEETSQILNGLLSDSLNLFAAEFWKDELELVAWGQGEES